MQSIYVTNIVVFSTLHLLLLVSPAPIEYFGCCVVYSHIVDAHYALNSATLPSDIMLC